MPAPVKLADAYERGDAEVLRVTSGIRASQSELADAFGPDTMPALLGAVGAVEGMRRRANELWSAQQWKPGARAMADAVQGARRIVELLESNANAAAVNIVVQNSPLRHVVQAGEALEAAQELLNREGAPPSDPDFPWFKVLLALGLTLGIVIVVRRFAS